MSEKELVARAKDGDFEAFSALINKHKGRIFALARKLSGNTQDAEDIVQDSFIKAIDKIDQFRGEAAFGTWLYSIALNESRSHLSKRNQTELKPIETYLPSGSSHDLDIVDSGMLFDWKDPHKILETQELRSVIESGLEELPYKFREAFLLRYFEEMSIKEIAAMIGESEAATKSRVLRARLAMRDYLSRKFEVRYAQKM